MGRYLAGKALTLEGVRWEGNVVYVCLDVPLGEEELVREDGRGRTGTDIVKRTDNISTVAGQGVDNAPHDAGPPLAVFFVPFACVVGCLLLRSNRGGELIKDTSGRQGRFIIGGSYMLPF